jgi:hypothetical protein
MVGHLALNTVRKKSGMSIEYMKNNSALNPKIPKQLKQNSKPGFFENE